MWVTDCYTTSGQYGRRLLITAVLFLSQTSDSSISTPSFPFIFSFSAIRIHLPYSSTGFHLFIHQEYILLELAIFILVNLEIYGVNETKSVHLSLSENVCNEGSINVLDPCQWNYEKKEEILTWIDPARIPNFSLRHDNKHCSEEHLELMRKQDHELSLEWWIVPSSLNANPGDATADPPLSTKDGQKFANVGFNTIFLDCWPRLAADDILDNACAPLWTARQLRMHLIICRCYANIQ